ncbi:MAG: hypothetical protein GX593_04710 [Actinomycetales bacterium]|nr:hypothetical protein [Actinomycetales bacterium]
MMGAVARKVVTQCLWLALWLWPIVIAVTLGVPTLVHRLGGDIGGIYAGASQGPRWFLFAMAIVVVAEGFAAHLALGVTRRNFLRQLVLGFLVVAPVYGALSVAVALVERWFFEASGWVSQTVYGQPPVPTDPWYLAVLDQSVLLAVFALSGLAVGAVYLRWGGWLGTLALPLTVGPVLMAATALQHVDSGDTTSVLNAENLPYAGGLAVALAVGVWFWAVARLSLRGAVARPARS